MRFAIIRDYSRWDFSCVHSIAVHELDVHPKKEILTLLISHHLKIPPQMNHLETDMTLINRIPTQRTPHYQTLPGRQNLITYERQILRHQSMSEYVSIASLHNLPPLFQLSRQSTALSSSLSSAQSHAEKTHHTVTSTSCIHANRNLTHSTIILLSLSILNRYWNAKSTSSPLNISNRGFAPTYKKTSSSAVPDKLLYENA